MERIVIVIEGSEKEQGVIELLKTLFPKCEMQVVSDNETNFESHPKSFFKFNA